MISLRELRPPHDIQQRLPLIMAPSAVLKTRAREEYPYKLEYRKAPPPPFPAGSGGRERMAS